MLRSRGIENLLVCGVTTEVCVNTSVREANDRGYRCVVLADCGFGVTPQVALAYAVVAAFLYGCNANGGNAAPEHVRAT